MTACRLIKKYPNRRLYDTAIGQYITLDDIKQYVRDSVSFEIKDARSQKDLTQSTLLQIIIEQEMVSPIFSVPFLQDFIRFYQDKSHRMLSAYLEQALHLFIQQKSLFQHQWQTYQKIWSDPLSMQQFLSQAMNIQAKMTPTHQSTPTADNPQPFSVHSAPKTDK